MSAGEKRRTVALICTSDTGGYYVDIFRSDLDDNDYIFHNVGTSLTVTDVNGSALPVTSLEKFDKTYHEGYNRFTKLRKSDYDRDFIASWHMPKNITSRLWMTGSEGREIYQADAPATTLNKRLTPGDICMPPTGTPTLIVRQQANNANKHPFVAVYEACKDHAFEVLRVAALPAEGAYTGVKVQTTTAGEDYVFSATGSKGDPAQYGKIISLMGSFY